MERKLIVSDLRFEDEWDEIQAKKELRKQAGNKSNFSYLKQMKNY